MVSQKSLYLGMLGAFASIGFARAAEPAAAACNAALGKEIFALCSACHTLAPNEIRREGPMLRGIVGRAAGQDPSFRYSPHCWLRRPVWDAAALDRFLTNPRRSVPGTMMTFTG